jgi:lysophospholipase L1-like esterase
MSIKEPFYCPIVRKLELGCTKKPQNQFPCCETLEMQPRCEPGDWVFEGDSEIHFTNIKLWYGPRASNFAIGGSTTADVIGRLDLMKERKPKRIVLSVAGNDVLRFIPKETVLENMDILIQEYLKITPHVYVNSIPWLSPSMKIPGTIEGLKKLLIMIFAGIVSKEEIEDWISHQIAIPIPGEPYNVLVTAMNIEIQKVCNSFNVPFINTMVPLIKDYDKKYYLDGIHYNNLGRKVVSDTINKIILQQEGEL